MSRANGIQAENHAQPLRPQSCILRSRNGMPGPPRRRSVVDFDEHAKQSPLGPLPTSGGQGREQAYGAHPCHVHDGGPRARE